MKDILYTILDTIIGLLILVLYIGLGIGIIWGFCKILELINLSYVFTTGMGIISAIGSVIIFTWFFHDIGYEFRTSLMDKLEYKRGKKND